MNFSGEFNRTKYVKEYIFNSFWFSKIINVLTKHTMKNKIEKKVYKSFKFFKFYTKVPPLLLTFNTIRHQKLLFRILKVRVAGRIYQLPTNFGNLNRYSTSLRWLLTNVSKKGTSMFSDRFLKFLINDNFVKNNTTDQTRTEIYKIITSFRGYLHFRWRN